jgi:nucleotide-binding universal stress UspA family protein
MPRKILVCVEMGDLAAKLVDYGNSLAHRLDVEVSFLHVLPNPHMWKGYGTWIQPDVTKEARESAQKKIQYLIKKAEEKNPEKGQHEHQILFGQGDTSEIIINTAKEGGFNLIVIGFKGSSGIEHMMVGSTTTNVTRYSHCSVLVYRPGEENPI